MSLPVVALCSHVVYVIEDIETFVRKLDSHGPETGAVRPVPGSRRSRKSPGLWEQVHGEPRHRLPCLPEFLPVLAEIGIRPEVTELEEQPPPGFDSLEEARQMLTRRLYVSPGTEAMARLERVLGDSLHEVDGTWQVRGTQPLRPCIVAWEPAGG